MAKCKKCSKCGLIHHGRCAIVPQINLAGRRFGKLVVIEKTAERSGDKIMWRVRCDCGTVTLARVDRLKNGRSVSCGCALADPDKRRAARMKVDPERRSEISSLGGEARIERSPDQLRAQMKRASEAALLARKRKAREAREQELILWRKRIQK